MARWRPLQSTYYLIYSAASASVIGFQRFAPESNHGANAGLDVARKRLETVKAKWVARISQVGVFCWSLSQPC